MRRLLHNSTWLFVFVMGTLSAGFSQLTLPWTEDFENVGPDSTFVTSQFALNGIGGFGLPASWGYFKPLGLEGRLRFNAGPGFARSGRYAATLDDSVANTTISPNELILSVDLSNYTTQDVQLGFAYMHHGEERDAGDSVWVRASFFDPWVGLYDLWLNRGTEGVYNVVQGINISAELTAAGQTVGSTVQIRFGQMDNGPVISTIATDGITFDDVNLSVVPPVDGSVTNITGLASGCGLGIEPVTIEIQNFGSDTLREIPVAIRTNGGTIIRDTLRNVAVGAGRTEIFTFTPGINLNGFGTYVIETWTELIGDGDALNDTFTTTISNLTVSTYPYYETFENGPGGWASAFNGNADSWTLTTPALPTINSAAGGQFSWITALGLGQAPGNLGGYSDNENSRVIAGPCFDLSSLTDPRVRLDVWWNMESFFDGAVLQSSTDGGTTWVRVGSNTTGTNWYNQANVSSNPGGQAQGWSGRVLNGNGSNGWVSAEHPITGLAGQADVRFRIAFSSDGSVRDDGFAFDNFIIYEPGSFDAGILTLDSPTNGCGLSASESVEVTINNYGSSTLDTIPVAFQLGNGPIVRDTLFNANIASGATGTFIFPAPNTVDLSAVGTYVMKTWTELGTDPNFFNDTLNSTIVNIPVIATFPYIEDFESGQGGWIADGQSSSWQFGQPSNNLINTASSGVNAWVTNLTGNYNNNENSFVVSPCYDFSSMPNPVIRFDIWWEIWLNNGDGAYMQASTDGGATWNTVGLINNPINWYNTNDGWAGRVVDGNGSGGWITAQHPLTGLGGNSGVIIRVVMESSAFTNSEGFAFDNVRIFDNASATDVAIINFNSPSTDGCSVSDSVEICYVNLGAAPVTGLSLSYNYDGNTTITQVDPQTVQPGDTACYTFTVLANVSAPGAYGFNGWVTLANDFDPLNDSLLRDTFVNTTVAVAIGQPWVEDFETFEEGGFAAGQINNGRLTNGWSRNPGDGVNLSWHVEISSTANSFGTGPLFDNTNFGTTGSRYMFTEASGATPGSSFFLESPCIDLSASVTPRLEFAYHMFGAGTGDIVTQILSNGTWIPLDTIAGQQQTAEGDPWRLNQLALVPYVGQVVKLRWRAIMGPTLASDMAIDDVTIYEVPPNDLGATALLSPGSAACYGSNEQVDIEVTNLGSNTIDFTVSNVRVYAQMVGPGPTTKIDSFTFTTGNLAPLGTVVATMPTTFDMSASGTYTFTSWTTFITGGPDPQAFNDSIVPVSLTNFTLIVDQSTSQLEDFETFTPGGFGVGSSINGFLANGWTRDPGNTVNLSWHVESAGVTNSFGTGPIVDATFNDRTQGQYMYTETSGSPAGAIYILESPCLDFTNANGPRMDFAYHMFGDQMGTIAVDGLQGTTWIPLDSIVGAQHFAEADPWLTYSVSLVAFAGQLTKVRFRYVSGGSFEGDASIDDVFFYEPLPIDGGVTEVIAPVDSCGLSANSVVTVRIENFGTLPLDTIPVAFMVDGGPLIQIDTMFLPIGPLLPGDDTVFTFTPTGDLSAIGLHDVEAWTTLFARGDANRSNDSSIKTVENIITISTFPYYEDFESGRGGWRSQGPNNPWEFGTPNGNVITSASSGTTGWMTGLSTNYGDNSLGWVESPCLDFASGGILFPMIRFDVWWETRSVSGTNSDGAKVQYSTDNGVTWRDLGTVEPDWYNSFSVPSFTTGGTEGWMGANASGDGSGGWVTVETLASVLSLSQQAKIRVYFESGQFTSGLDGFAIDNSEILEAPADLRNLGMPGSSGCLVTDTICIDVFNASATTFTGVTATYSVNGGATVTQTFPVTVNPGDTERLCFSQLATYTTAGTYRVRTSISSTGDIVPKNDTITNAVAYSPIVNTFPYFEDFESGSGGWASFSTGPSNSWRLQTPSMNVINTAGSGINSWVTQNGNSTFQGHFDNECSWVASPCFDLSSINRPRIRVAVNWNAFGGDGMVMQSSIDGGVTWVDVTGAGINWYNQNNIIGLTNCNIGALGAGWNGTGTFSGSQGWLQAEILAPSLANESQVQFRMYFGSSPISRSNGVAFDDFYVDDLPVNDLLGVSILSPRTGACADPNQDIRIVIKNEGAATQTTSPIRFEVNGPPTQTFTWNGNLATNELDTVTIGTMNTLGGGTFNLLVYTDLPGDQVRANDTMRASVDVTPLPAAPVLQADTIALCTADSTQLWVVNPDTSQVYFWYDANTNDLVGEGDTIQTTFLARDTSFLVQSGGGGIPLKITEIELAGPDFIEIQNLSPQVLDATGWTVFIGEDNPNVNNIATRSWSLGVFQPGEVQERNDGGGANAWGGNILWNFLPRVGWAMIVDDQCNVVDFIIWGYTAGDLANFNPPIPGCPGGVDVSQEWTSAPITATGTNQNNIKRIGNTDNNDDSDWVTGLASTANQGQQNPGLVLPFVGGGCKSPFTRIVVLVEPPINVNLQDQFICGPVTLDAGSGFAGYTWSTGDISQRITLNDTILTVGVTVTDRFGCSGTDTAVVESYAFPDLDLGPDTIACGNIKLDGGAPGCDYIWSNGSNDRIITYNGRIGANLVWAECIDPQTGCATRDSLNVDLLPLPNAGLPTLQAICDSGVLAVDPTVAGLPLVWSTGDTVPSIPVNATNRYYVTLTDTTNGCLGTDSVDVTINISPVVNLGPDVDACNNTELDAGIFGNFVFYDWNTTQRTQKIVVNQSGPYIVTVTDFNQCFDTDTINVNILPPPTSNWVTTTSVGSFTGLDLDFFELASGNGLTFDWDFGDGNTSTMASPSHTFQFPGFYVVCLSVTDSCGNSDQYCDTLNMPFSTVGLSGILLDNAIEVYPTPTSDFVNVSISNLDADVDMQITDARGRLIHAETILRSATTRTRKIDLSERAEGVYFINFSADGEKMVRKILKE